VVEDFSAESARSLPPQLISRRTLERHLDWLGARFRFISLDELGPALEAGEGFRWPAVAITFDDGYADVYENAFPLLQRKGIPAAVFVVSDPVTSRQPLPHDLLYWLLGEAFFCWPEPSRSVENLLRDIGVNPAEARAVVQRCTDPFTATRELLAQFSRRDLGCIVDAFEDQLRPPGRERMLERMRPLTPEMLRTMHQAGITIGSHTRTHVLLTNENPGSVQQELERSRTELESLLRAPVRHFAYPDGRFNSAVVRAVADAGYRYAYSTCRHRDTAFPLLTIPRRVLWEHSCRSLFSPFSAAVMSCQINGLFDIAAPCRHVHHSDGLITHRVPEPRKVTLAS
jgi:peptidoglycan/xylan/chitin deacetylase (PgdA/CDA1 family)